MWVFKILSDDEGDGWTDGEDSQKSNHSVFLIRDPFIGWEIWIIANLLETVSIIRSWSLKLTNEVFSWILVVLYQKEKLSTTRCSVILVLKKRISRGLDFKSPSWDSWQWGLQKVGLWTFRRNLTRGWFQKPLLRFLTVASPNSWIVLF